MKNPIRKHVLDALRMLAKEHLSGLAGVMVEETESSIIVRFPSLGAHWKYELSMEVNGYVAAPGVPLAEFMAKEGLR